MNSSIRFSVCFLLLAFVSFSCEKEEVNLAPIAEEAEWGGVAFTMTPYLMSAGTTVTDRNDDGLQILNFDELPTQSVDGLNYEGVTFGFTVNGSASSDARYNRSGPGPSDYWQCPCLEGNSRNSVLTLTFDNPSGLLEFGLARSTSLTLTPGLSVTMKDVNGDVIETINTTTTRVLPGFFTGTLFSFESAVGIKTAEISFPGLASTRFALDNLTYQLVIDTDGDGCLDDVDPHPNSSTEATVLIDGCDSEVANQFVSEDGCSNMLDLIMDAVATSNNHGQFVSQVAAMANAWKQAGIITGAEKGAIQSCAAQSDFF